MKLAPGLEGIAVAETDLSLVDGERGHLVYRGHWASKYCAGKDGIVR